MSKNVKYFSSDHFGAPPLKGDRWGYLVEMLRAVLCTGFNTRSDVSKVEVVSSTRIKITFGSIHNYSSSTDDIIEWNRSLPVKRGVRGKIC